MPRRRWKKSVEDTALATLKNVRTRITSQEDTPGGKANLKKARDEYIILQNKLAQLRVMCIEARNKNNRLDQARTQYQQRAAIRNERMRALGEIKAQIEKLRIVYEQSKPKVTPRRRDVK